MLFYRGILLKRQSDLEELKNKKQEIQNQNRDLIDEKSQLNQEKIRQKDQQAEQLHAINEDKKRKECELNLLKDSEKSAQKVLQDEEMMIKDELDKIKELQAQIIELKNQKETIENKIQDTNNDIERTIEVLEPCKLTKTQQKDFEAVKQNYFARLG